MAARSGCATILSWLCSITSHNDDNYTDLLPDVISDQPMDEQDVIPHLPKYPIAPNVRMQLQMGWSRPRVQPPKNDVKITVSYSAADINGNTALHEIAARGFVDCLEIVCSAIAKEYKITDNKRELAAYLDVKNNMGKTPLHLAAQHGRLDCYKTLVAWGLDPSGTDFSAKETISAFEPALHKGKRELTDYDSTNKRTKYGGHTMLHLVVQHNQPDMLDYIIANNHVDTNAQDLEGDTAAHYCCLYDRPAMLQALLKAGAAVDMGNRYGRTPLIVAARVGHVRCMEICLVAGASLAPRTHRSGTVIHAAAGKGFREALDVLARYFPGINVNVMNMEGKTPLSLAAERGYDQCVNVLLLMGASVDGCLSDQGSYVLPKPHESHVVVPLLDEVNEAESLSSVSLQEQVVPDLPLHAAAYRGQLRCLEILLEHGAHVTLQRQDGKTPLHDAGRNPNCAMRLLRALSDDAERIALLNSRDKSGSTPLHVYAARGHDQTLRAVLTYGMSEHKIDIYARDSIGNSPAHLAAAKGHTSCLTVLRQYEIEAAPPAPNDTTQSPYVFNCTNNDGETPAVLAANRGQTSVLDYLTKCIVYDADDDM